MTLASSAALDGELIRALVYAPWVDEPTYVARRARIRAMALQWCPPQQHPRVCDAVMALREQGLTDAHVEATLSALALGASFEQALDMLEAGKRV
jgi:hypothetical protein